jgi:hypothetical protein
MKTIVASVGRGGLNRTEDVLLVQALLDRTMAALARQAEQAPIS